MQRLLYLISSTGGEDHYRALARGIAEYLGVVYGLVGHVVPGQEHTMRILAVWKDGEYLPGFDYDLKGTPCEAVLERGFCHLPSGVAAQFPGDVMLTTMGIQSYLGFRVATRRGGPTGIVIGLHTQATSHLPDEIETVLNLLAHRAGVEFEHDAGRAALAASEAQYRRIVESCLEGVWLLDNAGNTSFVNAAMAEMLGYSSHEMLGLPLFAFMDEAAQRVATRNLERRRGGLSERHEFRLRHRSGKDVWTIMATTPILDAAGAYAGAQAVVTDLTERRRLEARVLQAQKLESLGVLAGGVAHDFNNMLVGILGNVDFVLQSAAPGTPAEAALGDIRDAGLRLAELTRQMLAYSGRGRFITQRVNLNTILEELTQLVFSAISKKAQLQFDLAPAGTEIEADATQIRQVVVNLVTNASDALDGKDGTITIATSVVYADRAYQESAFLEQPIAEGSYVVLEVTDTGTGMDANTREKIFDPFFSTKFAGRGLGLAAVLGILRGHSGTVRVQSELGQGTCFRLLLPQALPQSADIEAPPPQSSRLQGSEVVLVADDDPGVRKVAVRLLSQAGFEVLQACDGHEAVSVIDREAARISLVLLDLTMPGRNGAEVLQHIRATNPELRVVLSSGYDEHEAASQLVSSGLAGFLPKPWRPTDLLTAVSSALDR